MQPIAITQGDPAGIGPEIVAKAFRDAPDALRHCFVVGDLATVRRAADSITRPGVPGVPVAQIGSPGEAADAPPRCIPVLQLPGSRGPSLGARSAPPPAVPRRTAWSGRRVPHCVGRWQRW